MNFVITKNNKIVKLQDIPQLKINDFRNELINQSRDGKRIISFFGKKQKDKIILYAVLADDENSRLLITSTLFDKESSYESITKDIPSFYLFEREFYEEFGIKPIEHPWCKPVRYSESRKDQTQTIENYPFFKMDGEQVHEVGVGPIHAGIIEPGHFRFLCHGENVFHLEIQLGYQHRGVESLLTNKINNIHLAESISGDSVIAHANCYANLIESLSENEISRKSMSIRGIALELERIAMHIGDLGAISNDIAYLPGNAIFGATRTLAINTSLAIYGSRFGRGLIKIGGVNFDIDKELNNEIIKKLNKIEKDVILSSEIMFSTPSVLSRLEDTGIVDFDKAKEIGLVGFPARSSGVSLGIRTDHPFGIYNWFPIYNVTMETGDVFARSYIRYIEIKQSINFIREQLENFSENDSIENEFNEKQIAKDCFVVSMTEGWRGEIVHCAITDKNGNIDRYKIKDPSFNNWFGLALAVRNNGISDFPLCNKSFNLSYCGFDL